MADVTIKQGDTLIADCIYRDANGNPVNLDNAGITIKSCVRTADGRQRYELEYLPEDQGAKPGQYTLRATTANWKAGCLRWDIRYMRGEDSFSSKTMTIQVIDAVTPV